MMADRHDAHNQPVEPSGEVDAKLRAARYWITVQRPYYSQALFACRLLSTTAVETMTIDTQWRIYVNPDYILGLKVEETAALLIHNLNHVLRAHSERSHVFGVEVRLGNVWQTACDMEINDDLNADGLMLPEDVAYPYMFGLSNGLTAEAYHKDLIDGGFVEEITLRFADTEERSLSSSGSGASGFNEEHELAEAEVSASEAQLLRHSTAESIRDHTRSKGREDVPAGLQRWASAQLEPKVDWRKALASSVRRALHQTAGSADFSWRRLPRRQSKDAKVLRPGMYQPVPSIAVVIDTSASMNDDDLAQAVAEVESILARVVPGYAIEVLSVDAEVSARKKVQAARSINLSGGGGTDMRVGIAEAARSRPTAIVVLTDGYTPWPKKKPPGVNHLIAALVGDDPLTRRIPKWIHTIRVES